MNYKKTLIARERIARNLLHWRKERALTQEVLAASSDLSQTFYSQIETGKRNVSLDTLEKLATKLNIDILDLLAK
jgi:transcriptional regulator with XRE-family HTH domain